MDIRKKLKDIEFDIANAITEEGIDSLYLALRKIKKLREDLIEKKETKIDSINPKIEEFKF